MDTVSKHLVPFNPIPLYHINDNQSIVIHPIHTQLPLLLQLAQHALQLRHRDLSVVRAWWSLTKFLFLLRRTLKPSRRRRKVLAQNVHVVDVSRFVPASEDDGQRAMRKVKRANAIGFFARRLFAVDQDGKDFFPFIDGIHKVDCCVYSGSSGQLWIDGRNNDPSRVVKNWYITFVFRLQSRCHFDPDLRFCSADDHSIARIFSTSYFVSYRRLSWEGTKE